MIWMWIGFIAFILLLLAVDLGIFHRHAHAVGVREALAWSIVWIAMSLLFNVFIYYVYAHHWQGLGTTPSLMHPAGLNGRAAAAAFFTGYVIEKSLSVDNIFVIALIFAYFRIPAMYQHRVLFWGILGALIMRGAMIGLGTALIERFHWILYIFGAFLVFTALKMLFSSGDPEPQKNPVIRLAQRFFRISHELDGQRFMTRSEGRRMLTPLALALMVVEATDIVFAVDSIPAIFAITTDPFIVFTSNVCAILGLRALYFAVAAMIGKFHYLKLSLAVILVLVGLKMLFINLIKRSEWIGDNTTVITLGMVVIVLGAGVIGSIIRARRLSLAPIQ